VSRQPVRDKVEHVETTRQLPPEKLAVGSTLTLAACARIRTWCVSARGKKNTTTERAMAQGNSAGVRVIVVANEKGGSGKSTVGVHVAVALMKAGNSVASIDLDSRQRSFTHYIDNRLAWARKRGLDLLTPSHVCFDEDAEFSTTENLEAAQQEFAETLERLGENHRYIVVDTAGHNQPLMQHAHAMADTLITPLNDSFVDLDVLGSVDPESLAVAGISHYATTVDSAREQRRIEGKPDTDWIVLRNRLSMLASRNKASVGAALQDLSERLGFRYIDGLAERVVFREFYPRGVTALDELNEATLGSRPTMSHLSAQLEVQNLLRALLSPDLVAAATRRDAHAA
jgi:chromosome partitioning protein